MTLGLCIIIGNCTCWNVLSLKFELAQQSYDNQSTDYVFMNLVKINLTSIKNCRHFCKLKKTHFKIFLHFANKVDFIADPFLKYKAKSFIAPPPQIYCQEERRSGFQAKDRITKDLNKISA